MAMIEPYLRASDRSFVILKNFEFFPRLSLAIRGPFAQRARQENHDLNASCSAAGG